MEEKLYSKELHQYYSNCAMDTLDVVDRLMAEYEKGNCSYGTVERWIDFGVRVDTLADFWEEMHEVLNKKSH